MRGRTYRLLAVVLPVLGALACQVAVSPTPSVTPTPAPPAATPSPTPPAVVTDTPLPSSPMSTATPSTGTPVAASPTPTDTPLPSSPTAQAAIHYFRADVEAADPGDTITLEWHWSGGTEATIYHLFDGQLGTPWWSVGPSGSLEYTISPQARNYDRFALFVSDAEGQAAQETLEVELRCPDEWFFGPAPDVCPAEPALVTDGAEQRFEGGVMLWNRAEDHVYVLFADAGYPRWRAYEDAFEEGDPESDSGIVPPSGLYQPIRGFGLVWREQPGVRDRLGWAVGIEMGYEAAIQRTSRVKYNDTYVRALDGGVWRLGPEQSEWEHMP